MRSRCVVGRRGRPCLLFPAVSSTLSSSSSASTTTSPAGWWHGRMMTSSTSASSVPPASSTGGATATGTSTTRPPVDVLTPQHPSPTSPLPYRLMLTCEHASQLLPLPWRWPDEDRRLLNTHWALDLGSEELTRELSAGVAAPAVIAKFSRLLVDANRPLDSPTLFRDVADGLPVHFNRDLSQEEKEKRLERCYYPYHKAVSELQRQVMPDFILSLHSYTDNYEGQKRAVEVGVLYDEDEELAKNMKKQFMDIGGYETRLNEPWSGKEGFMYSADRHGHWDEDAFKDPKLRTPGWTEKKDEGDIAVIMLEMRNDLLTNSAWRGQFVQRLIHILKSDDVVGLVQAKKTKAEERKKKIPS